jgi:hypothetical protein
VKIEPRNLRTPTRRSPRCRGFTLMEAALATMIIGVGVVATLELFHTCARDNQGSAHMTTAMMLATSVQEMCSSLAFNDPYYGRSVFGSESGETLATYNDLDDLDGQTFSPPIDAQRHQLPGLAQYSQVVSVWPVYTTKLASNTNDASPDFAKTTYTGALRVTVRVLYKALPTDVAQEVYRASWIRMDR